MKIVNTAELVQLMMHLVEYQSLIIVCRVVLNNVVHRRYGEDIDHFNTVKIDHNTPTGTTRDILYLVCLKCYLTEGKIYAHVGMKT